MKHEPISSHEKPHIIQTLARRQDWQGRRKGVFVRIVRLYTKAPASIIEFYVALPSPKHGNASTVAEAIDEINRLIMSRDPQKEAEDALSRGETHL